MADLYASFAAGWPALKSAGRGRLGLGQEGKAQYVGEHYCERFPAARSRRFFPEGDELDAEIAVWREFERNFGLPKGYFESNLTPEHRHQLFTQLTNLDTREGRLISLGWTSRDSFNRPNSFYLSVEGDYWALRDTFALLQHEPRALDGFVATLFGWENYPDKCPEDRSRYERMQYGLVLRAKRAHFLDAGRGHVFFDRFGFDKRRRPGNPRVRSIDVLTG